MILILNFWCWNARLILSIRYIIVILTQPAPILASFRAKISALPDFRHPTHWRIPWWWSSSRSPFSKCNSANRKSTISPFWIIRSHLNSTSIVFFLPPWSYITEQRHTNVAECNRKQITSAYVPCTKYQVVCCAGQSKSPPSKSL